MIDFDKFNEILDAMKCVNDRVDYLKDEFDLNLENCCGSEYVEIIINALSSALSDDENWLEYYVFETNMGEYPGTDHHADDYIGSRAELWFKITGELV